MRLRGQLITRKLLRLSALSSILVTALIIAACSDGDETSVESTSTPVPEQSTPGPTATFEPVATPETATPGAVVVAPPRVGVSTFNDPDRDHTISGFIVDAEDGRPLRGITVREGEDGAYGISDEFGFYRIDGVDPGSHGLNISGYRVESSTAEIESETWTRLDLALVVSGDAHSRRVFAIVGRVTNRDSGDPVQGASVTATDVKSVTSTAIATSDEFGSYVIPALPQGRYELSVDAGGYPVHEEQLDVTGDMGWEVFLRPVPSLINGRVTGTGPNGTRLPVGASVRAINLDTDGGTSEKTLRAVAVSRVELDGAYALTDLPPGTYRIEARAPGYLNSDSFVKLSDGIGFNLDFDLIVDGASLRIALTSSTYGGIGVSDILVRVRGAVGTPAESVQVDVVTGPDGSVAVGGLPAGTYDIWTPTPAMVSGNDRADLYPLYRTLQLGRGESHTLDVDLPAIPGDIHGFVRGGDVAGQTRIGTSQRNAATFSLTDVHESFSYLPVQLSDARISITSARFGSRVFSPPSSSVTSDRYGNFVIPLPPGTYSLVITADGHLTTSAEVTIGSAPVVNDFRLETATTAVVGRITGTMYQDLTHLVDAAFAVAGTSVVLQHEDKLYPASTDERGVFTIENLPLTVLNGVVLPTVYEIRLSHPDYLPLVDTLSLTEAEGAFSLVRKFPTLAAGGFLDISIAITDKNGNKTAAIGTLESLQNILTMDVYDASFLEGADTIEVPNTISLRARPGQYRARICPETHGRLGCFDHFWTSVGGYTETLDLSLNCGDTPRLVKCSLDGGISASSSGHIQATGFVYSASTGEPMADADVTVAIAVLTEYCSESCTDFIRDFAATVPTGPNGRYQMEFQIPDTNGGSDLVGWSWDDGERFFTVASPGHQTIIETGPGGSVRAFNGTQDFHMAPTRRLALLVVSASSEGNPVPGHDPSLGVLVTGQDLRAVITLSPLGAELATGSTGITSFNVPPGTTSAVINTPGHYPYAASVLVPDAGESEGSDDRFTLPIEQIPAALIQPESLQITQTTDGRPLKGYVLRGVSSPATDALWEIRVDRNGLGTLRADFDDPIESVNLVISVAESCPGIGGSDDNQVTLQLRGVLLSGSASGVGTWGGNFDIAHLPCGVLGWRVEAHTSRSIVTLGFDWPLWPSDQRYPLSLITGLAGATAQPLIDPVSSPVGSVQVFKSAPRSLRVTHDGDYLVYEMPGIAISSDFGPPTSGRLLDELSGVGDQLGSIEAAPSTATLDGETGLLSLRPSSGESTSFSITATGLYSLSSAMFPTQTITSDWTESISAMLTESRIGSLELAYVPDPVRAVLGRFASSRIDGTFSKRVTADARWSLASAPNPGDAPPLIGERSVVPGTNFEIVSISEFKFAASVLSHLSVNGLLDARAVATFAEVDGSGSIREVNTVAAGNSKTSLGLWSAWNSTLDSNGFVYFDRDAGKDSVSRPSAILGETGWSTPPTTSLTAAGNWNVSGTTWDGGLPRPSIAAGKSSDGTLLVATLSAADGDDWPIGTSIAILQVGDPGAWSPPERFTGQVGGMVTDTAVTFNSDGEAMLVWSAIPESGNDPTAFIHRTTGAELFYSRLDPGTGVWTDPEQLTSDDRPDFAPVIASDGEGRVVIAWIRDMDGNVLTTDDIVVFASDRIAGNWTPAMPVMSAPGAASELSLSVTSGTAVIGIIADSPGTGRSISLSFNSFGRWSPVNVIAGGRSGITEVAVLMDRPGLATVAWSELHGGDGESRIVVVEATSAGVRGETVAVETISEFVDLALVPTSDSRHLVWIAERGASLHGVRNRFDGWNSPTSIEITSGLSRRLIAIQGNDGETVFTFHETIRDGVPGLAFLPLQVR
jgi:hypothetical protein